MNQEMPQKQCKNDHRRAGIGQHGDYIPLALMQGELQRFITLATCCFRSLFSLLFRCYRLLFFADIFPFAASKSQDFCG